MVEVKFSGLPEEVLTEMGEFLARAFTPRTSGDVTKTASEAVAENAVAVGQTETEKPKKPRAKKTEPVADTPKEPEAEKPGEAAKEATTYVATEQDARDALRRLHEATNDDTCLQVLNSFNGARRVSEVPEEQRTAFVLKCNEKIAAAAGKVS